MAVSSIHDITDFDDVIRLLEEHPEWRAKLRQVLLTPDLLELPQQMGRLTEQVSQIAVQVQVLAEAQQRTEARLTTLAEAQQRTEAWLATLTETVTGLRTDVATLKGHDLEMQYRTRRRYTFGRALRRLHVLSEEELDEILQEAEERGILSHTENEDITLADAIVRGRLRTTGAEVYLVVEVSVGVGRHDVERATKRAALLSKTGVQAIPAVAGEWVTPDARHLATTVGAWQFTPSEFISPTT